MYRSYLNQLNGVSTKPQTVVPTSATTEYFARLPSGEPILMFTLTDHQSRVAIKLIEWGASVHTVLMPDRSGRVDSVTLFNDSINNNSLIFSGAVIGRVAGCISNSHFLLDGKGYDVQKTSGAHCVNGGVCGLSRVLWRGHILPDATTGGSEPERSVIFEYTSGAGEEGFPDAINCTATYTLRHLSSGGAALIVSLEARANATTPVSLTSNVLWNLNGVRSRNRVHNHRLLVDADHFVETGDDPLVPTGRLVPVANTNLDFRILKQIGQHPQKYGPQRALDHCFVLNTAATSNIATPPSTVANSTPAPVACLSEPSSGRRVELYASDGKGLTRQSRSTAVGLVVSARSSDQLGVALSPLTSLPDSLHREASSVVLRPGQTYVNRHEFRLLVESK